MTDKRDAGEQVMLKKHGKATKEVGGGTELAQPATRTRIQRKCKAEAVESIKARLQNEKLTLGAPTKKKVLLKKDDVDPVLGLRKEREHETKEVSGGTESVQPAVRIRIQRKCKTDAVESIKAGFQNEKLTLGAATKKVFLKKPDVDRVPIRRDEKVLRRERAEGLLLPEHERVLADITEAEIIESFAANKEFLDNLWVTYRKNPLPVPDKVPSIESVLWATRTIPSKMQMFMLKYLDKIYTNSEAFSPSHAAFFMQSAIPEWITLILMKKLNCTKDEVREMHK